MGDFLSIQGDTYSYPDAIFASEVVKLGEPLANRSAEWRAMVDLFKDWDGYSNGDSRVLPIVTEMRGEFYREVLAGFMGAELAKLFEWRNESTFIDNLITKRPSGWLPAGFESYEELILTCYRRAKASLARRLGANQADWKWGKLAVVRFPHPLEKMTSIGKRFAVSGLPQNTGGSMPTVNAGARVSMRLVADLSDWSNTLVSLPLGQSGDPRSPHREDQLAEWRAVTPRRLPFDQADIINSTLDTLTMHPASA